MGAAFSKGGKVKQNGTDAVLDESLDNFNKTSTLPASFRKTDVDVTKSGTLPRGGVDLNRSTSFSKRFRKSITKLVGHKEVGENATESQLPTETSSVVLGQEECKQNELAKEEVDCKQETPRRELDPKVVQKRARAQFFQELYTSSPQPPSIPKPPRSRNIPSPLEKVEPDADIAVPATIGTPVVKLIEKHEEAIEKQHEQIETNKSINIPESENKSAENTEKVYDVISEPMNKDDGSCERDKQVEAIKQEEVSVVKEEINLREETILKEETSMLQSTTDAASNDIKIEQENYSVKIEENISSYETESIAVTSEHVETCASVEITKELIGDTLYDAANNIKVETLEDQEVIESNESGNISSYETESIAVTSEHVETCASVEITKELIGDTLYDAANNIKVETLEDQEVIESNESGNNGIKEPVADECDEFERKIKIEINEREETADMIEETEVEDETEEPNNVEQETTKDDSKHVSDDSCQVNNEISSQEEEDKMIDQSNSYNSQQEIGDKNVTEQNSLESINHNDEMKQTMTGPDTIGITSVTGESDLTIDTAIVDSAAKSPEIRSEGGSEGGVSTDEGIVASDDEENKPDFEKVEDLGAKENKSSEEVSEKMDPENAL